MSGGEIEGLGDVLVGDIAVGDEAHANVGVRIGVGDHGRDRPGLALGPFDQAAHRSRGVQNERGFDAGFCNRCERPAESGQQERTQGC